MSTPFNEYWLEIGAAIPVDIETTEILINEIKRLRSEVFNRGGWPLPKKHWTELNKEECWEILVEHRKDPFSLLVTVQDKLKEKNT